MTYEGQSSQNIVYKLQMQANMWYFWKGLALTLTFRRSNANSLGAMY